MLLFQIIENTLAMNSSFLGSQQNAKIEKWYAKYT